MLADLAEVLLAGDRRYEAASAFAQALERYEPKGNVASGRRVAERLAALRARG